MSIEEYLAAQRHNAAAGQQLPEFRELVPLADRLYRRAAALIPEMGAAAILPGRGRDVLARALVLCHRDFLAAATLIAQGQPIDAGTITRRAIEAACWARRMKADPGIFDRWEAEEQRLRRYDAWREHRKPDRLPPESAFALEHQLVKQLQVDWGLLSEGNAHFTPALLDHLWEEQPEGKLDTARLGFFAPPERVAEELVILAVTHDILLRLFDECFEGKLMADAEWMGVAIPFAYTCRQHAGRLGIASAEGSQEP